jgi:hypothetical protein
VPRELTACSATTLLTAVSGEFVESGLSCDLECDVVGLRRGKHVSITLESVSDDCWNLGHPSNSDSFQLLLENHF